MAPCIGFGNSGPSDMGGRTQTARHRQRSLVACKHVPRRARTNGLRLEPRPKIHTQSRNINAQRILGCGLRLGSFVLSSCVDTCEPPRRHLLQVSVDIITGRGCVACGECAYAHIRTHARAHACTHARTCTSRMRVARHERTHACTHAAVRSAIWLVVSQAATAPASVPD